MSYSNKYFKCKHLLISHNMLGHICSNCQVAEFPWHPVFPNNKQFVMVAVDWIKRGNFVLTTIPLSGIWSIITSGLSTCKWAYNCGAVKNYLYMAFRWRATLNVFWILLKEKSKQILYVIDSLISFMCFYGLTSHLHLHTAPWLLEGTLSRGGG